jgi:hypothetical protein
MMLVYPNISLPGNFRNEVADFLADCHSLGEPFGSSPE